MLINAKSFFCYDSDNVILLLMLYSLLLHVLCSRYPVDFMFIGQLIVEMTCKHELLRLISCCWICIICTVW